MRRAIVGVSRFWRFISSEECKVFGIRVRPATIVLFSLVLHVPKSMSFLSRFIVHLCLNTNHPIRDPN